MEKYITKATVGTIRGVGMHYRKLSMIFGSALEKILVYGIFAILEIS